MKSRVLLVHWKPVEAQARLDMLRDAGYDDVALASLERSGALARAFTPPPDAVVIDLSRLPFHGRDLAMYLRSRKATRHVPLIFVGGQRDKVSAIRENLPDAFSTVWSSITPALRNALANPVENPTAPASSMAGYSGTPLPRKLGIQEGSGVGLVNAPEGFEKTLGTLPSGARVERKDPWEHDLAILFCISSKELERGLSRSASLTKRGGRLWIAWPKKSSGVATNLTQAKVRGMALAAGLVDYKVCAIDYVWSGLLFAKSKARS